MKLQHKFGGFNILKEKPLISLGWFSGETSAYSRSLDHAHAYYGILYHIWQAKKAE